MCSRIPALIEHRLCWLVHHLFWRYPSIMRNQLLALNIKPMVCLWKRNFSSKFFFDFCFCFLWTLLDRVLNIVPINHTVFFCKTNQSYCTIYVLCFTLLFKDVFICVDSNIAPTLALNIYVHIHLHVIDAYQRKKKK